MKRAKLVNEIKTPLVKGENQLANIKMLTDLDATEIDSRFNEIAQISMPYLTEQISDKLRKNILLRLWTGCMEAAKAICFTSVSGIRDGAIIEAQYRLNIVGVYSI